MAIKSGSGSYWANEATGAAEGSNIVFTPAIGERGRITISGAKYRVGYTGYGWIDSTTLGEIIRNFGFTQNADTRNGVYDYIRKGDGTVQLTFVSGYDGVLYNFNGALGGIQIYTSISDTFPTSPRSVSPPYSRDLDRTDIIYDSDLPLYPAMAKSGLSWNFSATYTVFNAFWTKGSNRISGDEGNNV